ncbi:MAG: hypothetical protein V1915_03830 [Candidatus Bathyarchaeota archaeon]
MLGGEKQFMVGSYDVGSMPFQGDFARFVDGSRTDSILGLLNNIGSSDNRRFFENKVINVFVDKIKVGVSIPNYPQFRDMSEMFLQSLKGIVKTGNGYRIIDKISCSEKELEIPEVGILNERAREISERLGAPFNVKICVTGPYTLASQFVDKKSQLFIQLGEMIAKIIEKNVVNGKFCSVALVAVDEPVLGLLDDSTLDYGCSGREDLLKAWEIIFHKIKSRNIQSIIHLHNTTNDLFWQVPSLDIIESHVEDALYSSPRIKKKLEESDKFLKASICVTDFDNLIQRIERSRGNTDEAMINQRIAEIWTLIKTGKINPTTFLEQTEVLSNRLKKIVRRYGERVAFAGPECGLRSFPTYGSAIECLRRVCEAVKMGAA